MWGGWGLWLVSAAALVSPVIADGSACGAAFRREITGGSSDCGSEFLTGSIAVTESEMFRCSSPRTGPPSATSRDTIIQVHFGRSDEPGMATSAADWPAGRDARLATLPADSVTGNIANPCITDQITRAIRTLEKRPTTLVFVTTRTVTQRNKGPNRNDLAHRLARSAWLAITSYFASFSQSPWSQIPCN